MKKRLLAMLLCVVMMISFSACGDSGKNNTEGTENSQAGNVEQPSVKTLADYSDLSVVLTGSYEITDDDVRAYLSDVLYSAGIGVMKVTDRDTVQAGDIVKVDYTGYVNDLKFQGGSTVVDGQSNPQWIDVSNNCGIDISSGSSSGGFIDGFTDGLIGAKIGETASGDVIFPETYNKDTELEDGSTINLANQPATFKFDVHEIYVVVTPETLTDAMVAEYFAKGYGVTTVAELMDVLEEEIAYNYVINYLIINSEFHLPEDYLYSRVEAYQTLFEEIYCPTTGLEAYLANYGYTVDQMQVEWLEQIKRQVQAELVFAAIVENESLKIDEAKLEAYVQEVTSVGNSFFTEAEDVYKFAGSGSAEAGINYLKNEMAVKEFITANYDK